MMGPPLTCVLDASVAVKLAIEEERSAEARLLIAQSQADPSEFMAVPDLFFAECANVLWKKVRRRTLAPPVATLGLADLWALELDVVPTRDLATDAFAIACRHGVSVYDACYLALSREKRIPLLTADHKLAEMLQGAPFAIAVLA